MQQETNSRRHIIGRVDCRLEGGLNRTPCPLVYTHISDLDNSSK